MHIRNQSYFNIHSYKKLFLCTIKNTYTQTWNLLFLEAGYKGKYAISIYRLLSFNISLSAFESKGLSG